MTAKTKRQVEVYLMIGALLLVTVGVPVSLWGANSFNGFLSGVPAYSQIENTTAFYDGLFIDDIATEGRYASFNDTTITEETPTWDVEDEWDSLILTSTETENQVIFNWNVSASDLLNSKINQLRMKLNTSKELIVKIYAVKYDEATLTKYLAHTVPHVGADNSTVYWNWTASEILYVVSSLNALATDTVWMQIVIEGYDDDNHLTTADTILFQFATGSPSNAYSFTSWQILTFTAVIMGLGLLFVAFASTKYFNPLVGKVRSSRGGRKRTGPKRKRSRKRRK